MCPLLRAFQATRWSANCCFYFYMLRFLNTRWERWYTAPHCCLVKPITTSECDVMRLVCRAHGHRVQISDLTDTRDAVSRAHTQVSSAALHGSLPAVALPQPQPALPPQPWSVLVPLRPWSPLQLPVEMLPHPAALRVGEGLQALPWPGGMVARDGVPVSVARALASSEVNYATRMQKTRTTWGSVAMPVLAAVGARGALRKTTTAVVACAVMASCWVLMTVLAGAWCDLGIG